MSTTESTALARTEDPEIAEAVRQELSKIRQAGSYAVARQKELNAVTRMLAGMKWGDVSGGNLSEATRYAIARICLAYDADPSLHMDILGGKVYLNATYYEREINSLPNLKGWDQHNISAKYTVELRKQAQQLVKEAADLGMPELKEQARELMAKATYGDQRRAFYEVPDGALAVYETEIQFLDRDPVREANWAGVGSDPVGKAHPAKTARTRSIRRAGRKASRRLQTVEEKALQHGIEAEWEIVQDDNRAAVGALPLPSGPQAVRTGHGEPEAANPAGARELPVENAGVASTVTPNVTPPAFDHDQARKGFMANLTAAGIKGDARKVWCKKLDLPESTKDFTPENYATALEALVGPTRDAVTEKAAELGYELPALAEAICTDGKMPPRDGFLSEWIKLQAELARLEADV